MIPQGISLYMTIQLEYNCKKYYTSLKRYSIAPWDAHLFLALIRRITIRQFGINLFLCCLPKVSFEGSHLSAP